MTRSTPLRSHSSRQPRIGHGAKRATFRRWREPILATVSLILPPRGQQYEKNVSLNMEWRCVRGCLQITRICIMPSRAEGITNNAGTFTGNKDSHTDINFTWGGNV
jgi:hypothetical protein